MDRTNSATKQKRFGNAVLNGSVLTVKLCDCPQDLVNLRVNATIAKQTRQIIQINFEN